jgi:hypothetical protein
MSIFGMPLKPPPALYNQANCCPERGQRSPDYEMFKWRTLLIVSKKALQQYETGAFLHQMRRFFVALPRDSGRVSLPLKPPCETTRNCRFSMGPWLSSHRCAIVKFQVWKHDSANPTR